MTESIAGAGGNEKRTTKDNQGRGNDGKLHGHSRSLGAFAIASNETGAIQIPIYRANRKGGDSGQSAISSGDVLIGGILRNLISQNRNQVARRQADISRIEDELQELNHQLIEWEELLADLNKIPEQDEEN